MIRIIMHGCNGKMGRVITGLLQGDAQAEIVAGVDPYTETANDYPVYPSIADCQVEADVVIDFATAAAVDDLIDYCEARKMPVVLCTTGMTDAQLARIQQASEKVAILKSANMSIGINMLMDVLTSVAPLLAEAGFDIEIVEKHHNQKVDAPSGTALALADAINEGLAEPYAYKLDRSKERIKREKKEIGIQALRGGTIVGEHEVLFAGTDEVITFKHTAYSKAIFGKGAIQAAKFLAGQPAGMYDMSDVVKNA